MLWASWIPLEGLPLGLALTGGDIGPSCCPEPDAPVKLENMEPSSHSILALQLQENKSKSKSWGETHEQQGLVQALQTGKALGISLPPCCCPTRRHPRGTVWVPANCPIPVYPLTALPGSTLACQWGGQGCAMGSDNCYVLQVRGRTAP